MNRSDLWAELNKIRPTFSVGQIKGTINNSCMILRKGTYLPSMSMYGAGWDNYQIDIYSPTSPLEVDLIVDEILTALKNTDAEIESPCNGDHWEDKFQCFSTFVLVRIPNSFNKN